MRMRHAHTFAVTSSGSCLTLCHIGAVQYDAASFMLKGIPGLIFFVYLDEYCMYYMPWHLWGDQKHKDSLIFGVRNFCFPPPPIFCDWQIICDGFILCYNSTVTAHQSLRYQGLHKHQNISKCNYQHKVIHRSQKKCPQIFYRIFLKLSDFCSLKDKQHAIGHRVT